MQKYYKLTNNLVLRKEYFGGLVFNRDTGTIIDLDREAFLLLKLLQKYDYLYKNEINNLFSKMDLTLVENRDLSRVLEKLIGNDIIHGAFGNLKRKPEELLPVKIDWPHSDILSAPETMHWAATYRCQADCPDCYARKHKPLYHDEMDLEKVYKMIDILVQNKVFQLAVGGGEPLLRDDLPQIASYARDKGLVVNLTTGIKNYDIKKLEKLSGEITSLQIGLNHNELLKNIDREMNKIRIAVKETENIGFDVGVNLVLTRDIINNFTVIIDLLNMVNIKRIILLRYKPPPAQEQWLKQNPSRKELLKLESTLPYIAKKYSKINFRFDCALSFLERNLSSEKAIASGIRGCVAGDRIIAIDPVGGIYPCSQLIDNRMNAGNIVEDDFENIYSHNPVLSKYRNYRTEKSYKESLCGSCKANEFCGGCRVLSYNAIGGDPGCPEPAVLPGLNTGAKGTKDNSIKNKKDIKLLKNIQKSIGFTDSGFPYVSIAEIEAWIKDDYKSYPDWLNSCGLE